MIPESAVNSIDPKFKETFKSLPADIKEKLLKNWKTKKDYLDNKNIVSSKRYLNWITNSTKPKKSLTNYELQDNKKIHKNVPSINQKYLDLLHIFSLYLNEIAEKQRVTNAPNKAIIELGFPSFDFYFRNNGFYYHLSDIDNPVKDIVTITYIESEPKVAYIRLDL